MSYRPKIGDLVFVKSSGKRVLTKPTLFIGSSLNEQLNEWNIETVYKVLWQGSILKFESRIYSLEPAQNA